MSAPGRPSWWGYFEADETGKGADAPARRAGAPPLPRQKSDKCIEGEGPEREQERHEARLRSARKTAVALSLNVEYLCKLYGLEHLGFLTLTLPVNLKWQNKGDWKEMQRRWHSLRTNYIKKRFEEYVAVVEPQGSGRLHMHLLVSCTADLRAGINFEEIAKGNYRSANKELRALWKELRQVLPRYGFGRHELLPVKSSKEAIARYLGKYLAKSIEDLFVSKSKPFHTRRVRLSRGWRTATCQFAWAQKGRTWRAQVALVARECGLTDLGEFSERFGKRWAYKLRDVIMSAVPVKPEDGATWGLSAEAWATVEMVRKALGGRVVSVARN